MNWKAFWIVGTIVTGWTLASRGAEPVPAYEHLKPLEWLIGDWVGEFTAPFDIGPIKKGQQGTSFVSRRWGAGRNCILLDVYDVIDGKRVPVAHEVAAWDPARNRIGNWAFGPLGTGGGAFTAAGDKAVLNWELDGPDGKTQGTSVLEKIDADAYTWQVQKITRGGQPLPEWPKVTYRRKIGTAAGELWNAYLKLATGTWIGEGELHRDFPDLGISKGDRFKAKFSLKPEMREKTLVGESTFEMLNKPFRATNRVLAGWDPDTREVRFIAFWSGALVEEITLTTHRGTVFLGSYTAKYPGSATERVRIRMDFSDADSYAVTILDGPSKGEVLSSWKREKKQ